MAPNDKNSEMQKKLVEPSNNIEKTKQKLAAQKNLFLDLEKLEKNKKDEALKSIDNWIALHHGSREDVASQSMGLFKNNEESAEPSKVVKQMQKKLQEDFTN